jgi:hypothetical protein
VRGVEHLERGHDLARGHRLDLERSARDLADTLDEVGEVLVQRQARRPRRLHLERDGLLRVSCGRERCRAREREY